MLSYLNNSTTASAVQLSPSISYYIRKLLRQHISHLKFIVALGAGIKADPFVDLNAVLTSLYLDEPEMMSVVRQLENLAVSHQTLSDQQSTYSREIADLEEKIFWLLGFKSQYRGS